MQDIKHLTHREHFHGSDLEKIEKLYGIRKEEIISFSANVNPLGLSQKLKNCLIDHIDVLTSYPDREYAELRKTIGTYCGTSPDHIIVGNGSTELISLMIQLKKAGRAMILGPSYSEYEREISLCGGTSRYFRLREEEGFEPDIKKLEEALNGNIDLLVICNPNNPTSTCIKRGRMREILDICKSLGIFVMIDETYIEFVEDMESADAIPLTQYYSNLYVIRGISKFFAAPGLRLGYAVTGNEDLIRQINTVKDPWTINSLAEAAGKLMFTDSDYIGESRRLIFSERSRVCARLSSMKAKGLKYYEPSANFVLCRLEKPGIDADILFDKCIRERMMIRNCSTFPFLDNSYFRFCFMRPEDNDRLLDCIESSLQEI